MGFGVEPVEGFEAFPEDHGGVAPWDVGGNHRNLLLPRKLYDGPDVGGVVGPQAGLFFEVAVGDQAGEVFVHDDLLIGFEHLHADDQAPGGIGL